MVYLKFNLYSSMGGLPIIWCTLEIQFMVLYFEVSQNSQTQSCILNLTYMWVLVAGSTVLSNMLKSVLPNNAATFAATSMSMYIR